jgi:hypothetical protein
MIEESRKPILFLAFANDQQGGAYLRNLGQEAEKLRTVLVDPERANLCQVAIRTSVSAEGILNFFAEPAHKGSVALFHYAGHTELYPVVGRQWPPRHVWGNTNAANITQLTLTTAQEAFYTLNPVDYRVKTDPEQNIRSGFIAEEAPILVVTSDHKAIFAYLLDTGGIDLLIDNRTH